MDEKVLFPPVADPAAAGETELPRDVAGQPGCTGLAEQHRYGLTQPGKALLLPTAPTARQESVSRLLLDHGGDIIPMFMNGQHGPLYKSQDGDQI